VIRFYDGTFKFVGYSCAEVSAFDFDRDPLTREDEIVWVEDIEPLDYVRELVSEYFHFRQRPPAKWFSPGRLIGYSTLGRDARGRNGHFTRRLFWIADHDRSEQPNGVYRTGAPVEAVDPRTVKPKVHGRMTERAWGRLLPSRHCAGYSWRER